jgi:hypothetical protein
LHGGFTVEEEGRLFLMATGGYHLDLVPDHDVSGQNLI